ncbi:MAG: hypothetical protein ACREL5_08155 [Gemmatimonadales bacterium]
MLDRSALRGVAFRLPQSSMAMDFDDIKAQLDRIFASAARRSPRDDASALRQALVQYKMVIAELRAALQRSERELGQARADLADYTRRAELAGRIDDQETVRIAGDFVTRVAARVDLLERKVIVQRDEMAMAEREYAATMERFRTASLGIPAREASGAASGEDNPDDPGADAVERDRRAREAAVDAQLAHLKKKLGETK